MPWSPFRVPLFNPEKPRKQNPVLNLPWSKNLNFLVILTGVLNSASGFLFPWGCVMENPLKPHKVKVGTTFFPARKRWWWQRVPKSLQKVQSFRFTVQARCRACSRTHRRTRAWVRHLSGSSSGPFRLRRRRSTFGPYWPAATAPSSPMRPPSPKGVSARLGSTRASASPTTSTLTMSLGPKWAVATSATLALPREEKAPSRVMMLLSKSFQSPRLSFISFCLNFLLLNWVLFVGYRWFMNGLCVILRNLALSCGSNKRCSF